MKRMTEKEWEEGQRGERQRASVNNNANAYLSFEYQIMNKEQST